MTVPLRVAVIDSGVNVPHPHLERVAGGLALDPHGREHEDYVDRLGHGTAVAAAIHEKAPGAEIFVIKVFDQKLATSVPALVRAIDRASEHGARLINLSLGTPNEIRRSYLEAAIARTVERGVILVSAREHEGTRWFPGSLDGVVGVLLDSDQPREHVRVRTLESGARAVVASPFARPIPGVPMERNLNGISFAVANASGVLASILVAEPGVSTADAAVDLLARSGDLGE